VKLITHDKPTFLLLKIWNGVNGSLATFHSINKYIVAPIANPTNNKIITFELHEYFEPPQLRPSKSETIDTTKIR